MVAWRLELHDFNRVSGIQLSRRYSRDILMDVAHAVANPKYANRKCTALIAANGDSA